MIKRQSNVTIVAPTADNENTIGHFAYYLAQFGGFNLMSRLFVTDVDDRTSFVTIEGKEEDWEIPLKDFVQDLKELSAPKESWNIVVSATKKAPDAHVHFAHKNKAGQSMTTLDEEKLQKLYEDLSCRLQEKHEILSDIDNNEFLPVGKKNISVRAGGGNTNNAFLMRLSYSLITWTDRWTPVIVDMAGIMRNHLEKPERRQLFAQDSDTWREMVSSWKMKGVGFGDGEMLEVPEVTNRKRQ
jgi:voltage-gated potassium channel